jgi:tripartite-type tricarboxylate transporter receptor subunit TctC
MKARSIVAAAVGLALSTLAGAAAAQSFPSKPVRLVVPFTAGGTVDLLARTVGDRLQQMWKQQVVVDNKPGGGTVIATDFVAKQPADGHTILFMGNSFTINAALRTSLPYDPAKDFQPIIQLVSSPQAFVVNAASPIQTFKEFVEAAKAKPGQLSYGTVGPATTQHIGGEQMRGLLGIDMVYAPYPGGAPAAQALLGGHITAVIANISEVLKQTEAGKLRALAVLSKERIEPWPSVPTVAEHGLRDFEVIAWFGVSARAGLPADALAKLAAHFPAAVRTPEVREKLVAVGLYPADSSTERFTAHIRAETAKYVEVARKSGIKVE